MDLLNFLESQSIAVNEWSNELGNKTVENLQEELDNGESKLESVQGCLVRTVQEIGRAHV